MQKEKGDMGIFGWLEFFHITLSSLLHMPITTIDHPLQLREEEIMDTLIIKYFFSKKKLCPVNLYTPRLFYVYLVSFTSTSIKEVFFISLHEFEL